MITRKEDTLNAAQPQAECAILLVLAEGRCLIAPQEGGDQFRRTASLADIHALLSLAQTQLLAMAAASQALAAVQRQRVVPAIDPRLG
jgi:hypothetical protein